MPVVECSAEEVAARRARGDVFIPEVVRRDPRLKVGHWILYGYVTTFGWPETPEGWDRLERVFRRRMAALERHLAHLVACGHDPRNEVLR